MTTKERWRKPAFTVTTCAELNKHISASARSSIGCGNQGR